MTSENLATHTKASLAKHQANLDSGVSPEQGAPMPTSPSGPFETTGTPKQQKQASPQHQEKPVLKSILKPGTPGSAAEATRNSPKKSIWNQERSGLSPVKVDHSNSMPAWRLAAQRLRTPPRKKPQPRPLPGWDKRHQLFADENESRPKGMREYFSYYPSLEDLKLDLRHSKRPASSGLLTSLSEPELRKGQRGHPLSLSPLSADAELGLLHDQRGSHAPSHGGTHEGCMVNRDGDQQQWNNRFPSGQATLSQYWHHSVRHYFSQHSVYEEAPSQFWRRQRDYEAEPGVWRSWDTQKAHPLTSLGPLGGNFSATL